MEATFLHPGCAIDYTPGSAVAAGDVIVINGKCYYAVNPIEANVRGALQAHGVVNARKINGVAFAQGDHVWWDEDGTPVGGSATGCAVNWQSAIGSRYLGRCTAAAGATDERVAVMIPPDSVNPLRVIQVAVEDLAAGADFTARPSFYPGCDTQLVEIGILTRGAPAGVDDSNTAVIAITDDAGNAIVSKTYNAANQPPSADYASLGTLSATHSKLNAAEHVNVAVTQGASANLPAFDVVYHYLYL